MAKRKKIASTSQNSSRNEDLLRYIIKHLVRLKESNGLIIGTNAVFREIEKGSVAAVLMVSRKASSALYQALSLHCRNAGVLLFQLDKDSIISSTCCAIQMKVLSQQEEFFGLLAKINAAKNSHVCYIKRRCNERNKTNEDLTNNMCGTGESSRSESVKFSMKSESQSKRMRNAFISLDTAESDFPNYIAFQDKINFSVR